MRDPASHRPWAQVYEASLLAQIALPLLVSPASLAPGPPAATRGHSVTPDAPRARALLPPSLSARPAPADSVARLGVSLAARRSPALGRPPFPRWPRRARLLRRARGGGGVESLPHPAAAPGLPHQAAADDPRRPCGARCTDERRRCRTGAPSRPRRHPCSRHGGAAAAAAAGTRARGRALLGGEVSAWLRRLLRGSPTAREGGVGSSAACQVGEEHPEPRRREGCGAAPEPVFGFRATLARVTEAKLQSDHRPLQPCSRGPCCRLPPLASRRRRRSAGWAL